MKARNINGTESAIAAYSFEILPPWYRTYYAYFGYLVLFAVVLFLGIRLNTRRLQAAKTSLEGIVRERTAEISEQKDLILEQNQQLRALLKEKEMLIREVHHRVKNNLAVVSSMLSLQTMQIEEEKYRNLFQDSQSRIRTVALIHEKLYRAQELGKIVLPEYIPDLAQRIFDSQRPDNARVELKVRVDDVTLEADPAIHCGLLINELVTNALTHAFPAGEEGAVGVEMVRLEPGKLSLTVWNEGVGLPEEMDLPKNPWGSGWWAPWSPAQRGIIGAAG